MGRTSFSLLTPTAGRIVLGTCVFVLISVFAFSSISKTLNFPVFWDKFHSLGLPFRLSKILVFLVPTGEIIAAILLTIGKIRFGLLFSTVLLATYGIYIVIIVSGLVGDAPCSCIGIVTGFSWHQQLLVNTVLLSLACVGLALCPAVRPMKIP